MLTFKNYQLIGITQFLEKSELKPRASRVRTRLCRLLYDKIEDLQSDEMALLERFGQKDSEGKLLENNGTFSLCEETASEYHQEKRALLEESTSVNVDEFLDKIHVLIEDLEASEVRFSGKEAEVLDLLLEALESEISTA